MKVRKKNVQSKTPTRAKILFKLRIHNNSKGNKILFKSKPLEPVSRKIVEKKHPGGRNELKSIFKTLFKFKKHRKSKSSNPNQASFVSHAENNVKIPTGLKNTGQNCYLNSALQGISSCDKFVQDITDLGKQFQTEPESLLIFRKLICNMHVDQSKSMDISRNSIFKKWKKTGQQDSYELLASIVNQVYNEIRMHTEKNNINEWLDYPLPMRIIIKYIIKCECGTIVNLPLTSDLALHITVPLKNDENDDLQNLIDKFFDKDRIIDYDCSNNNCGGKNAFRYTLLKKPLPRTICIHLQRTFWNGHRLVKIKRRINFKKELKIKFQFLSESVENKLVLEREKRLDEDFRNNSETVKCDLLLTSTIDQVNINSYGITESGYENFDSNELSKKVEIVVHNETGTEPSAVRGLIDGIENLDSKIANLSIGTDECDKSVDDDNTVENSDCLFKCKESEENNCCTETENNDEEYPIDSEGTKTSIENEEIEYNEKMKDFESVDEIRNDYPFDDNVIPETTLKSNEIIDIEENNDEHILSLPAAHEAPNDVDLPDVLYDDVKHYVVYNTIQLADKEELVFTEITSFGSNDELNESFSLVSVIVHSGSINVGHYICYKCVENRWYLTNDSKIREVTENEVFSCEAYILFYEKL